jgi:hypothetical protein|tara:strand:+ start:61 stop:324 length:264 start_codon:yes stop_codon:yes gene_type:complete
MKNYYLLNSQQFDVLNKQFISYKYTSLDGTEILVITSQIIEDYLFMFESWKKFILHTEYNANLWCGDGLGIEMWELQDNEYLPEYDN